MNINYKQKYLKYKNKYLQIKKIYGGKNIIKGGTIIFSNNSNKFISIKRGSEEEAELWTFLYNNGILNIPDGLDGETYFNSEIPGKNKLKKHFYHGIIDNLHNIMNDFIKKGQHRIFNLCYNLITKIIDKRRAGKIRHKEHGKHDKILKHNKILKIWEGALERIDSQIRYSKSEKKEKPICRYFQQGYCRKGDQCHFQHEGMPVYKEEDIPVTEEYVPVHCSESEKDKTPICRYFQQGYCREGENCRFQHGEKPVYAENISVIEKDNVSVQELLLAEYTTSPPPSRGYRQKPESWGFGDPLLWR